MDVDYNAARRHLIRSAMAAGFPEEFGEALVQFLHSPSTMERMSSYLVSARPQSMAEVGDEAVALLEERATWIERMRSEEANAAYTAFLNRPRDNEDEDGED